MTKLEQITHLLGTILGGVLDVILHPVVSLVHVVLGHGNQVLDTATHLLLVTTHDLK
jgi:hypothetical protein